MTKAINQQDVENVHANKADLGRVKAQAFSFSRRGPFGAFYFF